MSRYFGTICAVDVLPQNIRIEGFKTVFTVVKSAKSMENHSKIEIYNLPPDIRSILSVTNRPLVRLLAGYKEHEGLVHLSEGNINSVYDDYTETDVITKITCIDGLNAVQQKYTSLSYKDGSDIKTIVQKLVQDLGLPTRLIDIEPRPIKRGFAYSGSAMEALNKICSQYNLSWSIQDGEMQVLRGKNIETGIITYIDGNIASPYKPRKDKRSDNIQDDENNNEEVIQTILLPSLAISSIINVNLENMQGNYSVQRIEHVGDNMGDFWYSNIHMIST